MEQHEPINPVRPLPENPKNNIIFLDPEKDSKFFSPISNKWYFVEPRINELTTYRVEILERRLIELGFTADFSFVVGKLRDAMKFIGSGKPHDAYTTLQNLIVGMMDLENKSSICLWVCSVFIYEEGENPWEYSDQHAIQKIKAWACFDNGFFLELAISSLAEYKIDLAEIFPDYSEIQPDTKVKRERIAAIKTLFDSKQS